MLHGYDYQLVQLPEDPTLHGTWNKVPAMREAIKHYEYVVFLDGDAIFTHLHLPLEWLFNYWSITNDTTMALAEDPERPLVVVATASPAARRRLGPAPSTAPARHTAVPGTAAAPCVASVQLTGRPTVGPVTAVGPVDFGV